jgi:hypothetical protein
VPRRLMAIDGVAWGRKGILTVQDPHCVERHLVSQPELQAMMRPVIIRSDIPRSYIPARHQK